VEGAESGKWAVLDFVDVIVHLFVPAMREYYQLERLWGDAPALPVAAGAGA
jgi:ribosome-associated protein